MYSVIQTMCVCHFSLRRFIVHCLLNLCALSMSISSVGWLLKIDLVCGLARNVYEACHWLHNYTVYIIMVGL